MTSPPTLSYATPRPTKSRLFLNVVRVAAVVLGVQLCLITDPRLVRPAIVFYSLFAIGVASLFAPVQSGAMRLSRWLEKRGPIATASRFAIVTIASGATLYAAAVESGRPFLPSIHDEFSYLLQTRMLAEGRLWLPPHPLADFFDTFYVITDRSYASQYFPGAASMFVPGVWLGLPFWAMPLLVTSAACGLLFLLLRELFDGLAGVAGVAMALGTLNLRFISISELAQSPALMLGTLALWSIVRWDATRARRFLWTAAVALGWCAITRPFDGLAFAAGVVALIVSRERRVAWRPLLVLAVAATPFLALQICLNRGVTGRWLETPFEYYAARDMPGSSLGFHPFDPSLRPASSLPQKQRFFGDAVVPFLKAHTPSALLADWRDRLAKNLIGELLADAWYIFVVPAAIFARWTSSRIAASIVLPIWWLLYLVNPFVYLHYWVVLLPSACVIVLAGVEGFARRVPPRRWRRTTRTALPLAIVALAVLALPHFRRDAIDQAVTNTEEARLRSELARLPADERRVVLVRFGPRDNVAFEPVYNLDRARIDDNPTIRAHDLGDDRNRRLYAYYARSAPDRVVYRYDRTDGRLTRLGRVGELASTQPTPTP